MGLDDFAPAAKAADDLDLDLFDFPPMVLPDPPQAEVAEEAEVTAEATDADGAAASEAAPAPAAAKPAVGCTGLNAELDVDIFDFPPIDLTSIGIGPGETAPEGIEESIDSAAQSVADFLEDDLGDIVQEAQAQAAPAPAAATAAPATSDVPAAQATAPAPAPVAMPAQGVAQVAYQPIAVAGPSPKALWVLTAAVILFMVGLLGIAWRATSSFQEQIQQVRNDVQASAQQLQSATTSSIRDLTEVENALLVNQLAAAKLERDVRAPQQGLSIEAPHTVALAVATQAMDMGRYVEARRMLFNLLAEADSISSSSDRESMERDALFLIANSHKQEAESLTGDEK